MSLRRNYVFGKICDWGLKVRLRVQKNTWLLIKDVIMWLGEHVIMTQKLPKYET